MTWIIPAEPTARADRFAGALVFIGALAIAAAVSTLMPGGLAPAGMAIALFVLAAILALLSWARRENGKAERVTYWDVAGALTFIGICAAALVDPATFVGIAEQSPRRN